jgi:hypothetical protein
MARALGPSVLFWQISMLLLKDSEYFRLASGGSPLKQEKCLCELLEDSPYLLKT